MRTIVILIILLVCSIIFLYGMIKEYFKLKKVYKDLLKSFYEQQDLYTKFTNIDKEVNKDEENISEGDINDKLTASLDVLRKRKRKS